MRIVTWNCHFGLTDEKAKMLAAWAHSVTDGKGADIYFIQEAEENDRCKNVEDALGTMQSWYGDHKEYDACGGGDLGLAIFSKVWTAKRINKGTERFRYVVPYTLTKIDGSEKPFTAFHVWTKKKLDYYELAVIDAIKIFGEKLFNDAVMLGDFNFGRMLNSDTEKHKHLDDNFNEAITNAKLTLVREKLTPDSWTNKKDEGRFLNDRCYIDTNKWKVLDQRIGGEDFIIESNSKDNDNSDHLPVMVELTSKEVNNDKR